MKKKIIILTIVIILLITGITCFIIWNNLTVSTITLDINPSIEINLTRNEKVKSINPLNKDAKNIINDNLKGKTLATCLNELTINIIDKGYAKDKELVILISSNGKINNNSIETIIKKSLEEKDIRPEIIIISKITKEDEELAKKYNITPAKASYINSITKENKDISIKSLTEKPISELKETKELGKYCDEGYNLEGDFCLKEIKKVAAKSGNICPNEYYEYEGNCYEETRSTETGKLICNNEFTLKGTKCTRKVTINAEPTKYQCPKGETKTRAELGLTNSNSGDANDIVCVDLSEATHPVSPCEANDGTEYTMSGGKCYWHRAPVIATGCPGKIQVAGECWDDATGIYICPGYRDGKRYSSRNEYCEHSIKYIDPVVSEYKCPEGHNLNGNKCIKEETEDAMHEKSCPSGYTLVDRDRCINKNKTTKKISGYICDMPDSRLEGNKCIINEIIKAKTYK